MRDRSGSCPIKITNIRPVLLKEWRTMLFVLVETDTGIVGLGESGLTSREQAVAGMIHDLTPCLIGQDPFRTEHLWQVMWRSGFHPAGQVLSAAIAAIDIALHDIKAKALGIPVYELLGGKVRDKVLSYCHVHHDENDELLPRAKARVAEGWKVLRFEPNWRDREAFNGTKAIQKSIADFKQLREALGPDIELLFDAHTQLTPTEASYFCRQVEQYRPMFIEDPLRSEHPGGYRSLRGKTAIPLAAGEQLANKWMFRDLVCDNLIDFCRLDLCIGGAGLTEARKIAGLCETHMIDMAVHNPIGPVSTAACLHLNLATANMAVQELPKRPGECLDALIKTDQHWQDGYLSCEGRPGLGVELDLDKLQDYPFVPTSLPRLHREDGAYTNW